MVWPWIFGVLLWGLADRGVGLLFNRQITIGTRLVGLRVYDSHGGRLNRNRATVRDLLKDRPFLVLG